MKFSQTDLVSCHLPFYLENEFLFWANYGLDNNIDSRKRTAQV